MGMLRSLPDLGRKPRCGLLPTEMTGNFTSRVTFEGTRPLFSPAHGERRTPAARSEWHPRHRRNERSRRTGRKRIRSATSKPSPQKSSM